MKHKIGKIITFLRCYQSLIVWIICVSVLIMTFFHGYLLGEWWGIVFGAGIFVNLYFVGKNRERYPLPGKFKKFAMAALIVSFLFSFPNFFLCLAETEHSIPEIVDGSFALVNYDGKGTKFITEEEYHHLKCVEQRLWAGHCLFFFSLAMYGHCEGKSSSNEA